MHGSMQWIPRALSLGDLPGLLSVQRTCYGDDYVEGAEVFARRIASAANCSMVLEREGVVCAYLAAYRSRVGKVTPLHGDFEPNGAPDALYLHDMAVHPDFAGQGLARALIQALWQRARAEQLAYSGLVSVQGSEAYWERQGYRRHPIDDVAQRASLASYGADAVYMLAHISAPATA